MSQNARVLKLLRIRKAKLAEAQFYSGKIEEMQGVMRPEVIDQYYGRDLREALEGVNWLEGELLGLGWTKERILRLDAMDAEAKAGC